jgi:hypothetical protein
MQIMWPPAFGLAGGAHEALFVMVCGIKNASNVCAGGGPPRFMGLKLNSHQIGRRW